MIIVTDLDTWGWEHAIRGLRNPMNSWDKSDSYVAYNGCVDVGDNDLTLMKKLFSASLQGDNHAHRKYLRQIFVSMDIVAPLYWWKEFDTYKIGVTSNSCSTMHKIHAKEFTLNDFSHEHLYMHCKEELKSLIDLLNRERNDYIVNKRKESWWQMIQLLPSSYNQKRTITMNYENVVTILAQRSNHKLDEWVEFCKILHTLPYVDDILGVTNDSSDNSDATN